MNLFDLEQYEFYNYRLKVENPDDFIYAAK